LAGIPSQSGSVPGVSISAAVIDLNTGRTWNVNPQLSAYAASVVKLPIFLALARVAPPKQWSANTRLLAAQMIEQSSNDAATTLWRRAGGAAALFREVARMGMTRTVAAPILLEPWDGVRTTAEDQARLLREVMKLKQPGSTQLLQLMQTLDKAQAWGVGYDLPLGWQIARKDGWVPVKGTTDWTTSSIGVVTGNSVSAAVAIITTGAPSYAAGRQVVNRVARMIDDRLLQQDV
jgi:beta-lactamase class A